MDLPEGLGLTKPGPGPHWTRGDLIAGNRLKFELFRRFGALPAAGDRHLAEFFPGFLTEESGWGGRWGVRLTTIEEREAWLGTYRKELDRMLAEPEVSRMPSGELVAAAIDSIITGHPRHLPLNLPNAGQCPDLPDAAVVESICTVDGDGIRGRDRAVAPLVLAEQLRRVVAAQELTVEAAVGGDRDAVRAAMLADPLAGRIDYEATGRMADELLAATAAVAPAVRVSGARLEIFATVPELAAAAAADARERITAAVARRDVAHVMFASGNSQLELLDRLTADASVPWSNVVGFHMDEYVGIARDHPASFARYMQERILARVTPRAFHLLDGTAPPTAECRRYARLLAGNPLDLCIMGIGENGHLAFNDPPVADFDDPDVVKVVTLDDACRAQQVGEGHFPSVTDVPPQAITVTVPGLLAARAVMVVAPEARKAAPVAAAFTGPVTTACPASVLQRVDHAVVYLDRASAAGLRSSQS